VQVLEDGSVVLNRDEAAAIARVLHLGRRVAEAHQADALLSLINELDDGFGISAEELTEALERRAHLV
jgi:hypothetical protein